MAFIWIGGPQLGIDAWSAGVALLVLIAILSCVAAIRRRNATKVALAGFVLVFGSLYFVYRTLVTPLGSWPVMYAAVNETAGAERHERISELMLFGTSGRFEGWIGISSLATGEFAIACGRKVIAECPQAHWRRKGS